MEMNHLRKGAMAATSVYSNNNLTLEVEEGGAEVMIRFLGTSILRDPSKFVLPILQRAFTEARSGDKRIVMDFRNLAFMNSSTITPVIKILEQARVGEGKVTVMYRKALKWQDVSFSALELYQTRDLRIQIRGE